MSLTTQESARVWSEALSLIRTRIATPIFRSWFEPITEAGIDADTDRLVLLVPSRFAKDWIEPRYSQLLHASVTKAAGRELGVTIRVGEASSIATSPPQISSVSARRPDTPELNPLYTFDTYVIGASNRFAHAAALAVAEAPGRAYNPLFIYGGVGLGKTHLLHAVGHYISQIQPDSAFTYVSSEKFTNEFISAVGDPGRIAGFKRRYRQNDVLLLDDVQFLEKKEQTLEEFFHTFNTLYDAGKQIVLTSDRPPKQLGLEERVRSRFEWGLITDVQPPDLETRIAILRKKADFEGYDLEDDILTFIASRIESNIRELEGALIRVIAFASLDRKNVSVALAETALKDLYPPSGPASISPELILAETSRYFDVDSEDLISPNRNRPLVHARQIAMYLCRELTDLSLPKIGEWFGGRDHTTVIHSNKKVRELMAENRATYNHIQELTARIRTRAKSL